MFIKCFYVLELRKMIHINVPKVRSKSLTRVVLIYGGYLSFSSHYGLNKTVRMTFCTNTLVWSTYLKKIFSRDILILLVWFSEEEKLLMSDFPLFDDHVIKERKCLWGT